jgi:hypothetical protein
MDFQRIKTRGILAGAGVTTLLALVLNAAPDRTPPVTQSPAMQAVSAAPAMALPKPDPVAGTPQVPAPAPPPPPPVIEVVFVLDTTGSMDDLLSGAKQKIWSIANHIASGKPTPDVRIGLVAYRDIGDAYVTRVHGLSGDLEKVHRKLMGFRADGGNDTPEHVWRGLSDGVNKMQWSDQSIKMVFLVGDAPPHDDYRDGYTKAKILAQAEKKGISIHAIRAGGDPETGRVFASLAKSGRGVYASIGQGGGWRSTKTPHDKKLAELAKELDKTAVGYGGDEVHARLRTKAAGIGADAMAADRASFNATTGAKLDEEDILDDAIAGKVDVKKLDSSKLPEEMRTMTVDQRVAHVAKQKARRDQLLKEMKALSSERNAYLRSERKAAPATQPKSMDDVINSAVEAQAEPAGVHYH